MLNKVILMGRLTSDPEHKQTQSGLSFVRFSIAVQRNFADKNGNRETDFINIVAWRQTADFICRYFSKGRMIAVEGSIQTGSYDDKNTGTKRYTFDVVADQVYFADSKQDNNNNQNNNNFPIPEPPPERANNNSYGNDSNQSYNKNRNSNDNYSYNSNDNYSDNNNSNNRDNSSNKNNYKDQSSGKSFSVGEFFEATEDDEEDDFPY